MFTGMEMMACQNLAVAAEVMQHLVNVESANNPYAIGVVGAHLVRQPRNLGEALATVKMLENAGYDFSVGLAQVNRSNLGKYGLASYERAFAPCPNLVAGSRILAQCYASAGGNWGKSLSCYYAGDFVTGYRDGYVQKVYASMGQSMPAMPADNATVAIPLEPPIARKPDATVPLAPGSAAYRTAMRSVTLNLASMPMTIHATAGIAPPLPQPGSTIATPAITTSVAATPLATRADESRPLPRAEKAAPPVFEPQVSSLRDRPAASTATFSHAADASTPPVPPVRPTDQADLRQVTPDDAFVF